MKPLAYRAERFQTPIHDFAPVCFLRVSVPPW